MITDIKNLIRVVSESRCFGRVRSFFGKIGDKIRSTKCYLYHLNARSYVRKKINRVRNLIRCVRKLRGYESNTIRYVCYYSSFFGGRDRIGSVRNTLTTGGRHEVEDQLVECRCYVYECYSNGWCQDWYDFDLMYRSLMVYLNLAINAWWAVRIFDVVNKITKLYGRQQKRR